MAAKISAGILLYKHEGSEVAVMLVHPGGPFWAKKDKGAWSIPKGEVADEEDNLTAAKREFGEETGGLLPDEGFIDLGDAKVTSSKILHVWALERDFDTAQIKSNGFEMDWPPKSGRKQSFPEVDKAAWFSAAEAMVKLHGGQTVFIERLVEELGVQLAASESLEADDEAPGGSDGLTAQTSLF